ncbi:MAG: 30S ribosomal protein S27e [Nitrososphaerota archaeon]|jgi:small subunit ribosomal protein S27e|nr:30S ribosomal protein S27e [Nitrososphaerota archaeon]MDG6927517.1 30S ribosomal protein S27e [Nitrososphaerota archaeon]MDG6930893.1 30S ribosomal protein S27e [Nitrososphaerota archaeon]MDG6932450.1 30S ribosomal protein S27e [Nitrososphaerota archaeon]MDG6936060.1 30S ribosomal protein S27e [Nitrososphaerota archaeon]
MSPKVKQLILTPSSAFYKVKCTKCGMESIIYSYSTTKVKCEGCGEILAAPTGGKAKIYGEIIKRLD